ncbi:hypothetical protein FVF58_16475 [Paraburkholderia panacisoli]|uniref:Uncharacterized protein n=1 Tax=Paraburkholderia panacisoli TaxID=2603818 RepID=A0A5B0H737_9BURK|nr:hypothetical protein [Paraburkholderia panacisoli]KAA1010997.1 hypothetical protein FVF58_16475 [Paraburkholderia panacisoli]
MDAAYAGAIAPAQMRDVYVMQTRSKERSNADILLLAMRNIWPHDPVGRLKEAGFDCHRRRSIWRVMGRPRGLLRRRVTGP